MVKRALLLRMYSNASRCRVGGYPASAPAMSKPTTPLSRNRIASSAISRDRAACRIAVTRQRTVMAPALGAGGLLAVGEAGQHRVDHRVQRQPPIDVQFGREPDLGVHDVVGRQVLDALVGHPVQRLRCLHHARPCARTARGSAPATRCARRCETMPRVRRRRWRAGRRSRSPRRARARWRAATRRRDGHAAGPLVRAGSNPGSAEWS